MDPDGLSSLSLLATLPENGRVLFLTDRDEALLQIGMGEAARAMCVRLGDWAHLPIEAASVDGLVIDLDMVGADTRTRSRMLAEIRRVLRAGGSCVAVVSHRRRPRNRRHVLKYRFTPPLASWLPMMETSPFVPRAAAVLRFDGTRLVEMQVNASPVRSRWPDPTGDAAAIVLTSRPEASCSALDLLLRHVEGATGQPVTLERLAVRKIGKTAAFLRDAAGARVVARIARSRLAAARAARNDQALSAIHTGAAFPEEIRRLVPRPVLRTSVAGCDVFVEECLAGTVRQWRSTASVAWEPGALQFITRLHAVTAVPTVVRGEVYQRLAGSRIAAIEPYANGEERQALRELSVLLSERLEGGHLTLVRTHGDFTGENCLYDAAGHLGGVIDWELSSPCALPLLDLLQAMDIAGESNGHPRWQRADLVLDAVDGRGPLAAAPEIRRYVAAMAIDPALVPMLLLMHWVDHVSSRIEARASDAAWMDRRMRQPLARIRSILQQRGCGATAAVPMGWS